MAAAGGVAVFVSKTGSLTISARVCVMCSTVFVAALRTIESAVARLL